MGQYYRVVNVDKKLYFTPWEVGGNGAKLMEWSYHRNEMVLALMNLLANEWKGDRVYVIGDYAEADDPEEPCYEAVKALEEEMKLAEKDIGTIYNYADLNFTNISALVDVEDYRLRYIYNHKTKQFIDMEKCPIEWTWYSKDEKKVYINKIAPISLLLAMGNDRGGGDFHKGHIGYEHVGSWCSSVQDIEVTADKIDGLEYEEFAPNFTEQEEIVPYTDEEKVIREEMKKYAELR